MCLEASATPAAPSADLARDLAHHASVMSSRSWTDVDPSDGDKQDVRSSGAAYGLSRGLNSLGDTSDCTRMASESSPNALVLQHAPGMPQFNSVGCEVLYGVAGIVANRSDIPSSPQSFGRETWPTEGTVGVCYPFSAFCHPPLRAFLLSILGGTMTGVWQ